MLPDAADDIARDGGTVGNAKGCRSALQEDIPMIDQAPKAAGGTSAPEPTIVPTDEPKENPGPSPDDSSNDEKDPLARELLPIGDPAGAA